jgi:hypothetical protein
MTRSEHFGANSIQATSDVLTARAGLASFALYLRQVGVPDELASLFEGIRKESTNSTSTRDIFGSLLCWLMNGDSRHLSSFDDLVEETGMTTMFDVDKIPSSHTVKRFLKCFHQFQEKKFRDLLASLFIRRLKEINPKLVMLGVDSMVLDNDDANCRHGVSHTYKGKSGYHPLQMTWENIIIDGIFRSGSRATHELKQTKAMIGRMVRLIREALGAEVAIIVRLYAGYFDQQLIKFMDEDLNVGFVVGGKLYKELKNNMNQLSEDEQNWRTYNRGNRSWKFTELGFKCKSWSKYYRGILTQVDSRRDGTMYLDFARPTSLFLTNIGMRSDLFSPESAEAVEIFESAKGLVTLYQGRGAEELCHRGLKDFGFEQLPMKGYVPNLVMYQMMLIGFACFELFKREAIICPNTEADKENELEQVEGIKATSYANTVRRRFIDVAAKIVKTGGQIFLKLRHRTIDRLKFEQVWIRCFEAPPLILL